MGVVLGPDGQMIPLAMVTESAREFHEKMERLTRRLRERAAAEEEAASPSGDGRHGEA
jgi:hypothetical protein